MTTAPGTGGSGAAGSSSSNTPAPTPAPAPAPAASGSGGSATAAAASSGNTPPTTASTTTKKTTEKKTKTTKKSAAKASGAGTTAKTKRTTVRKKKTTVKSSAAASNQATYNAARAAQADLAQQRAQAAARRSDPLWYRIEDVMPATQDETLMANSTTVLPEQIQIVESALAHNNLSRADVTPQAFACLLEQARRFAIEIIADSQDYAHVANRQEISKADLMLANDMRPDHIPDVTTQLPKLNLLAQQINRLPLPPIPTQCYSGVLLPPKQHQLTARSFDVVSGARVAQRMIQPAPTAPKKGSSKNKPSYGASRGRQIAIKLKESGDSGTTPMDTSGSTSGAGATGGAKSSTTNPAPK